MGNVKWIRAGMWTLGIITAGANVGCVNVHKPHAEAHRSAVMCDRCKTTWVVRGETTGKLVRYTREKAMVCPDCESAATHWMRTGELKHSCSHCRGKMTCEAPHSVGKNK